MENKNAWDQFYKTGGVEDYLSYRKQMRREHSPSKGIEKNAADNRRPYYKGKEH